jgi:hypothetical protein
VGASKLLDARQQRLRGLHDTQSERAAAFRLDSGHRLYDQGKAQLANIGRFAAAKVDVGCCGNPELPGEVILPAFEKQPIPDRSVHWDMKKLA